MHVRLCCIATRHRFQATTSCNIDPITNMLESLHLSAVKEQSRKRKLYQIARFPCKITDELPEVGKESQSKKMERERERERKGEIFFFKSYIRGRKSYQARKTFRNNVVLHGGVDQ